MKKLHAKGPVWDTAEGPNRPVGYIAWCTCGRPSRKYWTEEEAMRSLQDHIVDKQLQEMRER